ncbi:MAG TPA: PHP domain-containing protein [Candidatus Limiplasma sp.]|nr:PHP domain-containing protein [Candidatus Limiplasma sp.]HRX09621.1 PHP domain-containing protein [Candidatus Limiplasma sp.]
MTDIEKLNAATAEQRLQHLNNLLVRQQAKPECTAFVNNHIHTTYSFSPYTPTSAAYHAWRNGLATAGIMDHDSVSGVREFLEAGKRIGIGVTNGFECRCGMQATPFANIRLNNPDQTGVAYVACHGIPHQNIDKADLWLKPYRMSRSKRNRSMVDRLNGLSGITALRLDYDRDILPLSQAHEGGSVTERHILYALTKKVLSIAQPGASVISLLQDAFNIEIRGNLCETLLKVSDPYYEYRLLGVLKSHLVEKFYIDATDECPHILEFVSFVKSIGAVSAYAYLGDVQQSVTGDKRAQVFEDAFLDRLIVWLKQAGFNAVTFMPARNTQPQLERIMRLCQKLDLFQISGEDINTPFQSFICKQLALPQFTHLADAAWALIGHERLATQDPDHAMFSEKSIADYPLLADRIAYFAATGRAMKG